MAVILFCVPSVALTNRKALLHSFVLIFFKAEHGAVNRQSYLDSYWILLRCCCCLNRAVVSLMKSQLTFSYLFRTCSNQPITWLHNCVTTTAIIAVTSSCRDITCESIPGSPPPFLFLVGARGEPGNEAMIQNHLPIVHIASLHMGTM